MCPENVRWAAVGGGGYRSFPVWAAFPLAVLVAASAIGGICWPSTYAAETSTWAAQGVGQDWINLVVVVPWLATTAVASARGSRRALLLLGGGLAYTLYSYVLYALAVHFNALFLVYCAVLGLSFFAFLGLGADLLRLEAHAWWTDKAPNTAAGWLLIVIALLFSALWLAEVLPALRDGVAPRSAIEAGLLVNPVHVLDLAIVLPAMFVTGLSLLRRRALGYVAAPILLSFAVLMTTAIAGMIIVMRQRGVPVDLLVPAMLGVLTVLSAVALIQLLRHSGTGQRQRP